MRSAREPSASRSPAGTTARRARRRAARKGLGALLAAGLILAAGARAGWEPIGPIAGGATPVAIVGDDLYAVGAAGIWRSPDRGATWSCAHVRWTPLDIVPFGPRLYAAAGASGILVSADRGTTWKSLVEKVPRADSIPLHTASFLCPFGKYLVAGTSFGIYRSADSGATWKRVDGLRIPADGYLDVHSFARQDRGLFAATDSGIYLSADSGAAGSWKRVAKMDAGWTFNVVTLARFAYAWGAQGILRSSDQGATWDTLLSREGEYNLWSSEAVLYLFDNRDTALSQSLDSGRTWLPLQKGEFFRQIYRHRDTLWAESMERGMLRSTDGGKRFTEVPMRAGIFYALGASGDRILAPGYGVSNDLGATWERAGVVPVLQATSSISAEGDLVLGVLHPDYQGVMYLSRDGGISWDTLPPLGPPSSPGISYIHAVAVQGGRLFAARNDGVYRSTDSGSSWLQVRASDGTGWDDYAYGALQPAGPDLFLADSGGVFRSADGGNAWVSAKKGITGRTRLLAGGAEAVYAAGDAGIFRSVDRGESWIQVNAERKELPNLLAYGKTFLATCDSDGVELSLDAGATWQRSNDGLSVTTWALAMAIAGRHAYVSTYGGSIWKRPLAELFPVGLGPKPSARAEDGALRLVRGPSGTAVAFALFHPGRVGLDAFDPQGRLIAVLAEGPMRPGTHVVSLGARKPLSDVLFLRLRADGAVHYLAVPPGL